MCVKNFNTKRDLTQVAQNKFTTISKVATTFKGKFSPIFPTRLTFSLDQKIKTVENSSVQKRLDRMQE